MLPVFWNGNNHGNAQAALIGVAFAARHHTAVIAVVEDEGIIEKVIFFELFEKSPHLRVDCHVLVEVVGVGAAKDRCVGMVGGKFDLGWISLELKL